MPAGKCELYHWIDILDICDEILETATARESGSWVLACDQPEVEAKRTKELVLWTLNFTTLKGATAVQVLLLLAILKAL